MIGRIGRKWLVANRPLTALTVLGLVFALLDPDYVDLPRPIRLVGDLASAATSDTFEDQEEAPASPAEDDLDPAPTWAGVGQARSARLTLRARSGRPDPDLAAAIAMAPMPVVRGELRTRGRIRWSKAEPTIRHCRLLC